MRSTFAATAVKEEINFEVSKSGFFALIVDKTQDITQTEQLTVILRYIFYDVIYEVFTGYEAAFQLDAASLLQSKLSALKSVGIDAQNDVYQCYDCASVTSGRNTVVQAKLYTFESLYPLPRPSCDCVKNVKSTGEFFASLQKLNFLWLDLQFIRIVSKCGHKVDPYPRWS